MPGVDDLISVRRWRRYGADRLYVTQECGAPVGSIDLQSGEVVVAEPGFEDDVRRAAQEYLRADVAELVLPARPHVQVDQAETRRVEAALEAWLGTTDGAEGGPRAERGSTVGDRLDRLIEEGWQTVHDVPLGRQGSLVEHLLIGPGGLFTLTERRHRGQVLRARGRAMHVDGRPVAYLRDARLEAARVADRLAAAGCAQIHVRAVLVLQGELDIEVATGPDDPLVLARHEVPAVFRRLRPVLDERTVLALAKVARRRGTWSP